MDQFKQIVPTDLPEFIDTLARWFETPSGKKMGNYHAMQEAKSRDQIIDWKRVPEGFFAEQEAKILRASVPYFVSKDMGALVSAASDSMPWHAMNLGDLPVQQAFVWLDETIYIVDNHMKRCGIKAFHWAPVADAFNPRVPIGVMVTTFSDRFDIEDEYRDTLAELDVVPHNLIPRLLLFGTYTFRFGKGHEDLETLEDPNGTSIPIEDLKHHPGGQVVITYPFFRAFWNLLQAEITSVKPADTTRAERRRIERVSTKRPSADVNVVTLRRPKTKYQGADGEHAKIEYDHRWMVTGHWRNQPYPSLGMDENGDPVTRPKWIAGYIKGPEDKDLKIKPRVNKWVR